MENIIKEIITQIRKIPSLDYGERIPSYMFFNITLENKAIIFKAIQDEFLLINKELDSMDLCERKKIYEELKDPFREQEIELEKRYEGTERYNYVLKLHAEANSARLETARRSQTLGSTLKKEYSFKELNITEYLENDKEFDKLNSNMSFHNLIPYIEKHPNYIYYKPTDEEIRYLYLKEYINDFLSRQSIVCHSTVFEPELDKILGTRLAIRHTKWFFLTFEISQDEFVSQASEKTKTWINFSNVNIYEF